MSSSIKQCKSWLDKVVVKHNFCPFAKREVDNNTVRYVLSEAEGPEKLLYRLMDECQCLENNPETETTLIVIEKAFEDFEEFLDLVALSEQLMADSGYDGVYQLANFHPDYCFEGVTENDASNYTNRSPFPMLHLLRSGSLEKALENYPEPEQIPEKNIESCRQAGADYFEKILTDIKKSYE